MIARSPQQFLDLLHELDVPSLFDDASADTRGDDIQQAREGLRQLQQQLDDEMRRIGDPADGQNFHDRLRTQQALAPYLEIQRLMSGLAAVLNELEVDRAPQVKPEFGTLILENQDTGIWHIITSAELLLWQTQAMRLKLANAYKMKAHLQKEIEAINTATDARRKARMRRTAACFMFAVLILPLAFAFAAHGEYAQTAVLIGASGLGVLAGAFQLEFARPGNSSQQTTPLQDVQQRLNGLEITIAEYRENLRQREQAFLEAAQTVSD